MPTTFEVIFLGTLPRIDTTQGNEFVENAAGLLGSYGTSATPLSSTVQTLSPVRLTEDDNATYDTDNGGGFDSFSINGGTAQNFDGVATYDATITYVDGTTATISAVIFQDVNGNTYLAPETTLNTDQAALTAKPIQSLSLNAVLADNGDMTADRIAGDFKSAVDGTAGDDTMTFAAGYVDADGDAITTGSDFLLAGDGNDFINPDNGDDTVYAGAGNDTIDDWGGNDLVYAGDGADRVELSVGNDTIFMESGDDSITLWDNAGANVLDGGIGTDTLDFANWQSTTGAKATIGPGGVGTFTHSTTGTTGTFTNFEIISGTDYSDSFDASNSDVDLTLEGGSGDDVLLGGSGNDTILGDNDNDTVFGGDGADRITGGNGNDSLSGGAGDDYLDGGAGVDTLLAGDGNDVISVSDDHGTNTIDGGGWYDQLVFATPTSSSGVTVVWSGDRSGTYDFKGTTANGTFTSIEQSSGTEHADTYDASNDSAGVSIYAMGGNDTLIGGSGADRLYGEAGGDSLIGGAGNDTLEGGTGNDTLDGGSGNDTIIGGLGDDLLVGGDGDDVFLYVAGDGLDTISDFNLGNTGGLLDGDATNNDAINLSPYYDTIFELWADQADDGILNQSNTTDTKGNVTDYSNNTQFASGQGLVFTGASADSTFFTTDNTGVVCFAKGTLILTTTGEVPIERLCPGDQIVTRDNGPQDLIWVASRKLGRSDLVRAPKLRPIRIAPDLIAGHSPLIVSPQHGVLFRGDNGDETLVRATHLARMRGGKARVMQGCQGVSYFHLAFAAHQIIYANGAASESFYPGPHAVQGLAADARTELSTLFPDLEPTRAEDTYGHHVRPVARYCDLPEHLGALAQAGF